MRLPNPTGRSRSTLASNLRVAALAIAVSATLVVSLTLEESAASQVSALPDDPTYLNQARLASPIEPAAFDGPATPWWCTHYPCVIKRFESSSSLTGVSWADWGNETALGNGIATIEWSRNNRQGGQIDHGETAVPVTIVLGKRVRCARRLLYTSMDIALSPGVDVPIGFSDVQHGDYPCQAVVGSLPAYFPNSPYGRSVDEAGGACAFQGINRRHRVRRGSNLRAVFCRMNWKRWGRTVATGKGVLRDGTHQWGTKVVLSRMRWCRKHGIAYTRMAVTYYGDGELLTSTHNTGRSGIGRSDANRLRRMVDRAGEKRHGWKEREPVSAGCEP